MIDGGKDRRSSEEAMRDNVKNYQNGLHRIFGPSWGEIAVLLFFAVLRWIAIGGLIGLGIRFFIK